MKAELLLKQAMEKISEATTGFHLREISRLSKIAERAKEILTTQRRLDDELDALTKELNHTSHAPNTPSDSSPEPTRIEPVGIGRSYTDSPLLLGPIAIAIDWSAVGKTLPKQTICERKASDTLRAFFEAIHEQFGSETLSRLVAVRANRAPLLSQRPETEFLNPRQGVCYQHQQIGSTGWYVLTHSSTPEKLEIIRQVARALRFPPGAVDVREVDLEQQMESLFG